MTKNEIKLRDAILALMNSQLALMGAVTRSMELEGMPKTYLDAVHERLEKTMDSLDDAVKALGGLE